MKNEHFTYSQCVVTTIANTTAIVPAGRHLTLELNTTTGGVSIRPAGSSIDIGFDEWKRLQLQGLVRA